jgi:hypothetical protein
LQAGEGLGRRLGGEPFLLGLLEALDLPAGLRMVCAGVVEPDPEPAELDLQGDSAAAAGEPGEDGTVVGEHAGGDAPAQEGIFEGVDDVGAGDGASGEARQGEPGVVVEDVEDLHRCAVGELPVGGVGLPAFVGLLGGKGAPRRPRSLVRLRGDKAAAGQDPPDRGDRRTPERSGGSGSAGLVIGQ